MGTKPTSARVRLDRGTIVEAAIVRIERHGLDELSARKLAQDLGCEAMSLYHHVGNMEGLKDEIVDRLLGSIPGANTSQPAAALAEEARSYLALSESRPHSFALIASRRWKGERAQATAMRAVTRFQALGLEPQDALTRARALGAYLNGAGLALAAWTTDPNRERPDDARQVRADLYDGLKKLIGVLTDRS